MIFLRTRGLLYWTYCARTVAENGQKDAFSVISDGEWNPYANFKPTIEFRRFFRVVKY